MPDEHVTLDEIKAAGFARGKSIASWQDLPEIGSKTARHIDWGGVGTIATVGDAFDYFLCLCSYAENSDRSYSPFEFTASALNSREDSEEAWDAFDASIQDGFVADWQEREAFYDEK